MLMIGSNRLASRHAFAMWPETPLVPGSEPGLPGPDHTHGHPGRDRARRPGRRQRHQRAVHSANETPPTGSRVSGEGTAVSALNAAAASKAIVAPLRQSHPWIPFRITHPIVPGGHAAWLRHHCTWRAGSCAVRVLCLLQRHCALDRRLGQRRHHRIARRGMHAVVGQLRIQPSGGIGHRRVVVQIDQLLRIGIALQCRVQCAHLGRRCRARQPR